MQALDNYGFMDRMVHRLAFEGGTGQQMLCDLEARLYGELISQQPVERPVFVTALPRAGTTLLLEVLSRHPEVVTHTYRDMPFVLSPIMWRKMSGRFRVNLARRERAHDDGMLVDADSPEAFEEVLWMKLFPDLYGEKGIGLWPADSTRFREPLTGLIQRLIASRALEGGTPRYVSKNNANIARLPALRAAFPKADILVPLRHPLDHAISLHRQHMRFLDMHGESGFARAYMRDIGHFEFGALHRPILFDGMAEIIATEDPRELSYWVGYWIMAYRHLAALPGVTFVDMEGFTAGPDMPRLLESLDLSAEPATVAAGEKLVRPIKRYDMPADLDGALADEALALYDEIRSGAFS